MTLNKVKAYKAVNNEKTLTLPSGKINIQRINTQRAEALGTIKGVVLHWTAGPKTLAFDDYHINIVETASEVAVIQTLNYTEKGMHLYKRNTGMIGVSMASMQNPKLKSQQPSALQLEATALIIAEICCYKNLNPEKEFSTYKLGNPALVSAPIISDHKYWAIEDMYYPDRWDIDTYYAPLRLRAIALFKELKANKRKFQFQDIL